jgi:hypothetical protein
MNLKPLTSAEMHAPSRDGNSRKKIPTPLSVYQIAGVAMELMKLNSDLSLQDAMRSAFEALVHYSAKIDALNPIDKD